MKIKKGFVVRTMGDRKMVVPVGHMASSIQGLISLNETAASIWKILEEEREEEEIVDLLLKEYEADRSTIEECVRTFISELEAKDILER